MSWQVIKDKFIRNLRMIFTDETEWSRFFWIVIIQFKSCPSIKVMKDFKFKVIHLIKSC
jgi:hypothetical protein